MWNLLVLAFGATSVVLFLRVLGDRRKLREFERTRDELSAGAERLSASIEDRARARQTLRESVARFRTLVEFATEAILLLDVETMSFAEVNDHAAELFGYTRDELLELRPIDMFPRTQPDGRPTAIVMEETMQRVLEGKGLVVSEVVARRANGELFNVALRSILLPGETPQVRSTIIDVTDRIRKEEILRSAAESAEKANRAKTAFLANMSHEIRTPMNGVLGMLELLIDSQLTREQRHSAELAKLSAESLLRILNDILDISKIEAGQLELEHIAFDLHEVVNSVVGVVAPKAFERGVEIHCHIQPGVPRRVIGDPVRLRQVVSNLVSNAVKFTRDGEVLVYLAQEQMGERDAPIRFSVRDTGIGIPKDRLGWIFGQFVQVDASITRRFGGTGLGLAICKELVALMGGTLSVESEPGRGSEFTFSLTLEGAADRSGDEGIRSGVHLKGQRVLAVDDNPTNRRHIRETLEYVGLRVIDAADVYSALRAARIAVAEGDPFDLAILDAAMPDRSGFDFARAVGADPNLAGLKMMMLTSADRHGGAREAEALGIHAYLTKPVPQAGLLDCVNAVLGAGEAGEQPVPLITEGVMDELRRSLKVLLAEDNAVNQRVATAMLRKRGHQVDVVDDGVAAVEAVRSRRYDVVLMDVQMPGLDGLAATRQIRADGFGSLRIIALTAHATTDDRDRCREAGMNDFLSKPFQPYDLFRMVEECGPEASLSAEPPQPEAQEPVDIQAFRKTMDEAGVEGIVEEILRSFLLESPERIRRLQDAVASGDTEEVRKAAHALKSSSSAIGARGLSRLLQRAENAGRNGEPGDPEELMAGILDQYQAVVHQLERSLPVTDLISIPGRHE